MRTSYQTARHALHALRRHGGVVRTSQATALGIAPHTLYALCANNQLIQLGRGLFRVAALPALAQPDLTIVAAKVPEAVVCLISALAWHELTTEIPHEVTLALPRGTRTPKLAYPPVRVFRFSPATLAAGIETHQLDGVPVRLFNPAKTVADCFKFRRQVGLDVALEGLKLCLQRRRAEPRELLHYARLCRVERVMQPYLEALV